MKKILENVSVYAIVVNWNGKKDTQKCLASLEQIDKKHTNLHVVTVDNGSTDGTPAMVRTRFPGITLLETGKNLGFTGGNNLGITYAMEHGADFVWILNNDTLVDKNVLSCISVFNDPKVGICGSRIYFAAGHEFHHERYKDSDRGNVIWYAGGIIDWNNMLASHRGVDEVDHGQYETTETTSFVTGCSMIIRRDVIKRIGLLDERYYLYLEDLDYCLRAQKAGFALMYVPTSVLWHVNAGSSARPGNTLHEYYLTRNRLLLGFTYASLRTRMALTRESLRYLLTGSWVRRKAVLDAFLGRFGNQFSLKQ